MKLKRLLVFIVLNAHSSFGTSINTNNKAVKIDESNSYFPEVTYPSSIFDLTEPFYYKSPKDDVLAPFSDDVKQSYKDITSQKSPIKNSVKKIETKVADIFFTDMPKCSIFKNDTCTSPENICNILSIEQDDTLWHYIQSEDMNEMKHSFENYKPNNALNLNNNDINQAYSVTDPDYHKSLNNQRDLIIFDGSNKTLDLLEEDLKVVNNSYLEEEHALIRNLIKEIELSYGGNFSQFDEINGTDFENVLSALVFDYVNYIETSPSESLIIQPQVEDTIFPELSELTENSSVFDISKYTPNIKTSDDNFKETEVNPDNSIAMEIQKHLGYESKENTEGNDFFLELIISLNHLLQNNDFQMSYNSSDYKEIANFNETFEEIQEKNK